MIKLYTVCRKPFHYKWNWIGMFYPNFGTLMKSANIFVRKCVLSLVFLVSESARSNQCPAVKIFKTKNALITEN